jgi:hypothetical protein
MTAADPTRLPDAVVRGESTEDPTVVIPVVPRPRPPMPPPVAPPPGPPLGPPPFAQVPNPYGPPAGLGGYPPPPAYAPAPRRPRAGWVVGGLVGAVAAVALLVGIAAAVPSTITVTGAFTLVDEGYGRFGVGSFTPGGSCRGDGGYSDIHAGTQVTIADAAGSVVGTGRLGTGTASSSTTCEFTFTVADVPAGEDFYRLTISRRGTMTYTAEELEAGPELSLGS